MNRAPFFSSSLPPQRSFAQAYRDILRADGGERVFRELGFAPGQRFVSPFRDEARKKNFSVYRNAKGVICFKDFVSADGGTFTALLQRFGYASFESQIRFAARLYHIELNERDQRRSDVHEITRPQKQTPAASSHTGKSKPTANDNLRRYRVTEIQLDDFTDDEIQIIKKLSAGIITKKVLQQFGARALRSYQDEGRTEQGRSYGGKHQARYTLTLPSANGNYYAYCYYQSELHSPFPNRAKNFHLKIADYDDDVKFALGLNELRPSEPAYLVEGVKDCLILLAKGYNAFTLGGVQHRLHPSIVNRLQDNDNTLIVLFDVDFAGIDAAKRLAASLQTSSLRSSICALPRLERQETKDAPKPQKNDIADYVTQFGFDALLEETLLAPAPLDASTLTKGSLTVPAWKLSIADKLGQDKAALKTIERLVQSSSRLVLRAPTGCGKTFAVLRHTAKNHFERTSGLTVFAVPTIAMAEQIKQEYRDLKPIVITGEESDLHRLYDTEKPLDTYLIITVFDSASRLLDILNQPNTLFVIDEAHKMVQEYGFRTPAMRAMNILIKQAPRVLCLSATPELLFHEAPLNFTFCDVAVQKKRPLRFTMQNYDKREKAVVGTILQALKENSADIIMAHINSKSLLKRTQTLLVKHGVPQSDIDLVTGDTRAVSPEYRNLAGSSRFRRKIILTTSVLDCGVNILNEGRALVIMADEKNEDTIVQIANRFRAADDILVRLFYANDKSGKHTIKNNRADTQIPLFDERRHFQQTRYSAEMFSDLYNRTAGRNTSADCGLGRKSASRLQDAIVFYQHNAARWTVDECAIMHCLALLRIQTVQKTDLLSALQRYGFTFVMEDMIPTNDTRSDANRNVEHAVSDILTEQVREAAKSEAAENEEIILRLLERKTAYFLAALNTVSRSKALKNALPRFCPEALLALYKNHIETAAILANHGALLREARTDTLVRYYTEARALGFDHAEAIHLVRENSDPRKWASFTERLAMKQREAICLAGLTDGALSKHDRDKLRREEEIRSMIRNSANLGCVFTGADGAARHIPYAIRTKKEIADRVNAYVGFMFRLTRQKAGELVDAMFHLTYLRERVKDADDKTRFGGYYAFAHDGGELRRKTLAEFVSEYGLEGATYAQRFMEKAAAEARRYEQTRGRDVWQKDGVCAESLV